MEIWSKCDICGRDIPVGELCYGLKKGNCICKNCCTGFENCTFTLAPMPTLIPPNEPLTLEQLREMDGEPVWVEFQDGSGGLWGIVHITIFAQIVFANGLHCTIGERYYGKSYKAYRRQPEGEEDT